MKPKASGERGADKIDRRPWFPEESAQSLMAIGGGAMVMPVSNKSQIQAATGDCA